HPTRPTSYARSTAGPAGRRKHDCRALADWPARPSPSSGAPHDARRVGLLARCQVLVWRWKDARVDPGGAGRGAVVFERAEAAEVTARGRLVAVDLLQDLE